MFGLFKKKDKSGSLRVILKSGNAEYADFVREFFAGLDRPTRAHVLVAYKNLGPMIWALENNARNSGKSFSLDDFIIQCEDEQAAAKDEINSRRYAWFMWAALLFRLERMASRDTGLTDALASAWADLARDAPLLKALLPDNVVWKAEEKVWFAEELANSDPELVTFVINHSAPKIIWPSVKIKELAEEYGFFYFPDSTFLCVTYHPDAKPTGNQ